MPVQERRRYERSYKTKPGEPARRGKKNQARGAEAEAHFMKLYPSAKKSKSQSSDFTLHGKPIEVKYGTSGILDRQKDRGVRVVRFYKIDGRMYQITEDQAKLIKKLQEMKKNR